MQQGDVLELLLPDVSDVERDRARDLTRFLRLLADEARGALAPTVRVDLGGAAREMERHGRERILSAVEDLLRHHLHASLPDESFLWLGEPALSHVSAWDVLAEHRRELAALATSGGQPPRTPVDLAEVPRPGEAPVEVAGRLLECASALGLSPERVQLWAARLTYVRSLQSPGELDGDAQARWLAGLRAARKSGSRPQVLGDFTTDLAAAALDRGDVRGALALLEEHEGQLPPRARALLAWSRKLLRRDAEGTPSVPSPLPRVLSELRDREPSSCFAGDAVSGRERVPTERVLASRRDVGAVLVAWLWFSGEARRVGPRCARPHGCARPPRRGRAPAPLRCRRWLRRSRWSAR